MKRNPYDVLLEKEAGLLLARPPADLVAEFIRKSKEEMRHVDADNEWKYVNFANWLHTVAYVARLKGGRWSRAAAARELILFLFSRLLQAAKGDRWYHNQPGKGDSNIDRFVLLPFIEAYLLTEDFLDGSLASRITGKVKGVLDIQLREYGQRKPSPAPNKDIYICRQRRNSYYPNMDVYYCLLMYHGHRMTGDARYGKDFRRYLKHLEDAQFPGGAWTYINGTNECPVYHDINVLLLGRLFHLSGNRSAATMIRKSVPYYPLVVERNLISENYTDPWWKHYWSPQAPHAPDTVASLTGDGRNRWIGNRLRRSLVSTGDPYSIYAAMLWKPVRAVSPKQKYVVYDADIEGPRGRFRDWAWAATARYGSDTVVGALSTRPGDGVTGLLAVTPEIELGKSQYHVRGMSLGMTPDGTKGVTSLRKDGSTFNVTYRMAHFRSIWETAPFPYQWECRQQWRLDRRALRGKITVTSLAVQSCPAPWIRIRLGQRKKLIRRGPALFSYGPFQVRVLKTDLNLTRIAKGPAFPFSLDNDSTEVILHTINEKRYAAGRSFETDLEISFEPRPGK